MLVHATHCTGRPCSCAQSTNQHHRSAGSFLAWLDLSFGPSSCFLRRLLLSAWHPLQGVLRLSILLGPTAPFLLRLRLLCLAAPPRLLLLFLLLDHRRHIQVRPCHEAAIPAR